MVAMGKEFWGQLSTFIRGAMVSEKTISPEDLELLRTTDSPQEAVSMIREGVARIRPIGAID
jgi:hypothetical protein